MAASEAIPTSRIRGARGLLRMGPALALALALFAASPPAALAHAQLERSTPPRGAMLARAPGQVDLTFGEAVEANFEAVRVYDATGRPVQEGSAFHPDGRGDEVAVRLRPGLRSGSYTTTYRVVSADSHPVQGGFTFMIGHGGPAVPVSALLSGTGGGAVTATAFSVVRALQFAAIALGLGAVAFLVVCWLPGLREVGGAGRSWRAASEAFAGRLRMVVAGAAILGALSAVAGILLEGAVGAGTSVWHAARLHVVGDVLEFRFGIVWGAGALAWLLILGLWLGERRAVPSLRPATLGAAGQALPSGRLRLATLAAPLVALAFLPALGGHGSLEQPVAVMFPSNVAHVLAMGAWIGGVAILVLVRRAATAPLEPADRARLLAATVGRFSFLAGIAVAVLLVTGLAQGVVEVRTLAHLFDTAFGRAVLIKVVLLCGLVALGAVNRRRLVPAMRRAAMRGAPPGAAHRTLRRTLRAELALGIAALAATGALAGYAPSIDAATGPYSTTATIGPARLEAMVDPALAGANMIHLELLDRHSGRAFRAAKELHVTAALPAKRIAAVPLSAHPEGPGRYMVDDAALAPAGQWRIAVTVRVSAFDQYTVHLTVPIR